MNKWADYLVSAVCYQKDRKHLDALEIRVDFGGRVSEASYKYPRRSIINLIKSGYSISTIHKENNEWTKGTKLDIVNIGGQDFVRYDGSRVDEDYVGSLPEFD